MSCRVLKREMEDTMMNVLVEKAREYGINKIIGYYYPTAKNRMVKDFYGMMGFDRVMEDEEGNSKWKLDVSRYDFKKPHMRITSRFLFGEGVE